MHYRVNGDLSCSPSHIPSLAPTSAIGTRHPSLEMRLDGSIDSWLPADTMKLKRRVGAMLGVQNVENMVVKARAGSIVVTLTILEGASVPGATVGAWVAKDGFAPAMQTVGLEAFAPLVNPRSTQMRAAMRAALAQPAPSLPCWYEHYSHVLLPACSGGRSRFE